MDIVVQAKWLMLRSAPRPPAVRRTKLDRRLGYLGTLGSNAPFVGLFGTLIGIILAFEELSRAGGERSMRVALRVRVDRAGSVRSVVVSRAAPLGQGFGFAARDCLLAKRFSPALDRDGQAVAVVSPITVHFLR